MNQLSDLANGSTVLVDVGHDLVALGRFSDRGVDDSDDVGAGLNLGLTKGP
jgi:hypothetical protein